MNKLTKIIAVILVLLAVCLAALAWWMGHQAPVPTPSVSVVTPAKAAYSVVVAAKNLEKGKAIAADGVKLLNLPMTTNGTYADAAEVIGKIPAGDIVADKMITEDQLVRGLALKLADGERAVAIPVDEVIGVGNRIVAGDYVDVFFTLKKGNDIDTSQSRLLASRQRVLTYGATTLGEASSSSNPISSNQNSQPAQARTAVLATPVDQVNQLLLAAQNGKLTLVLRHPGDAGVANIALFPEPKNVLKEKSGLSSEDKVALKTGDNQAYSGVDLSSWASGKASVANKTVFRSSTRASNTVEVIKGTQRENVGF
ncbi:Flp pilus assembly protein CpaB [Herminiimonas arsenitoxidans]|uniref:Flp pilus assembly protein CpaB n=1 Tax=Herminiimonas arsenitoxidans TaxID=1809410 RepID=UPI0009711853|nr:Flp pilus assembly protein CpaB [Herminiimonas arsenitoxidans]